MALTKASYSMITGAPANVLDFGAVGNGIANDTTAFNLAIATGKRVYVPEGTYLINVTINNKTVIYGDGSTISKVKPFNTAIAAMTYTALASTSTGFWTYHSEIHNLGFYSEAKVGVGFTFGQTNPANYVANDEFANQVDFYNCYFYGLDKGVQFPFGNIGTSFYSCGFAENKYGVYTLNNKYGSIMHAGNKYFYGGEFSYNTCAFYCNNTADGFGGITFTNTIFEQNSLAAYFFCTGAPITAPKFDAVWFEANTSSGASISIDSWTGSTLTTQSVVGGNTIFDNAGGSETGEYKFVDSFFSDCQLKAANTQVIVETCRSERASGVGGVNSSVTGDNSLILQNNCYGDQGPSVGKNIYSTGFTKIDLKTISATPFIAEVNWFNVTPRTSKVASYGPSLKAVVPFTGAESTTGAFPLTGTVVSDGQIYSTCNEFTVASFTSAQFTSVTNSAISTVAGFYVYTFDAKITAGNLFFYLWDRGSNQFSIFMEVPDLNNWYSFAAIGYSSGAGNLFLDFGGDGVAATWRVSAFQIHRFDTFAQAQAFLNSGTYATS
jgi:hypothetical protein